MDQGHRSRYLSKLGRQVIKECFSFGTDQITPVLIALVSAWAVLHFKLVPLDQTKATYFAYLLPFAVAFGIYFIYQTLRAPSALHDQQVSEIRDLTQQLQAAQRAGLMLKSGS